MRKKYLLILSLIFSLMVFVSCTVQSGSITIGSLDSGKDYIKDTMKSLMVNIIR